MTICLLMYLLLEILQSLERTLGLSNMYAPNLLFKTKLGFIYDGEPCMVVLTAGTKVEVLFGCLKAVYEHDLACTEGR